MMGIHFDSSFIYDLGSEQNDQDQFEYCLKEKQEIIYKKPAQNSIFSNKEEDWDDEKGITALSAQDILQVEIEEYSELSSSQDMSKCEEEQQGTTSIIGMRYKNKKQSQVQKPQIQKKQKIQQQSQVETKNLPNYYGRQFINRIKKKLILEKNENKKSLMISKLAKFEEKKKINFNLIKLRELLDEEYFREECVKYLTSFDFLHDLMQSDKQKDVLPPIKYAGKMYDACSDRGQLFRWKDC